MWVQLVHEEVAAVMRNSYYGRLVMLSMLNHDTERFRFP